MLSFNEKIVKILCWIWGVWNGIGGAVLAYFLFRDYNLGWGTAVVCCIMFIKAMFYTGISADNLDGCSVFDFMKWLIYIPMMVIVMAFVMIAVYFITSTIFTTNLLFILIFIIDMIDSFWKFFIVGPLVSLR